MKKQLTPIVFATLFLGGSALVAQQQSRPDFNVGNGDFVIRSISRLVAVSPDGDAVRFEFEGSPLTGSSKSQDFRFMANSIRGRVIHLQSGDARLEEGTMSGSVFFAQPRTGQPEVELTTSNLTFRQEGNSKPTLTLPKAFTIKTSGGGTSTIVKGNSGSAIFNSVSENARFERISINSGADIIVEQLQAGRRVQQTIQTNSVVLNQSASGSRLNIPGKVNFRSVAPIPNNPGKTEVITLSASQGDFSLQDVTKPVPSGQRPIKSATLSGPVRMTLQTINSSGEPVNIDANGSKLTMNGGLIQLTGDVRISFKRGTDSSPIVYEGVGSSDVIEVVLTPENKLKSWRVTGGPAKVESTKTTGGGE